MKRTRRVAERIFLAYRRHTTACSILIVAVFVLLANFAYIFVTNPDPLLSRSGLPVQHGSLFVKLPFAAGNSIEGNDGITKQALGVQAAHQVVSGRLPLWNYYEGIGAPLLGETQSAALSPFTLLLLLPYGFLINELVLEAIAGIGMYLFARRLKNRDERRMGNTVVITAGCLFATLGTFMMLPNACFNPIAFLPWMMLAVTLLFSGGERVFGRQNVLSMLLFALSMALSLNAGFPEIAFINMLLVLFYALILFVKTERSAKLARAISLAIPGAMAALASLPWLIEFFTYINPANGLSGLHNSTILNGLGNVKLAFLSSFIPNIIGFNATNPIYGSIGGFFTVSCVILAVFAVCDKNVKLWQKLLFGGWFVIGWLRIIGLSVVSVILAHIPLLGSVAVYRYIPVSMSFCLIVLVCLGLDGIAQNKRVDRRIFGWVTGFTLLFYGFVLYGGRHYLKSFITVDAKQALFAGFFVELSVFASIAVLVAVFVRWRYKKQFICLVLVVESALCFAVWQFGAYTKTASVDAQSVQFLQQNLGTQRFDSNLLNPNYGSYFDISELSMMDLPIPTLWSHYITKNIQAYIPSIGYLSNDFTPQRIEQDEQLGVKYLLLVPNTLGSNTIEQQHLKLVYSDQSSQIFALPGYRPYFSGSHCFVADTSSFDMFRVDCSRASQLTRLELFYPGWQAKVDGKNVDIVKTDGLFQSIYIPRGKHSVTFYYQPEHMTLALVGAGISGIVTLVGIGYVLIARKR